MTDPADPTTFVVVPALPGRLLRAATGPSRPRDDLDLAIDELLPTVTEGPSAFDVVLVVAGLALAGWGLLGGGPGWSLVVGVLAAGLGVVLPIQAAARAARDRRQRRGQEALAARGALLDTTSTAVRRLVAAHDDLLAVAADAPPDLAGEALGAAHAATLEVASLLAGRPATEAGEVAFVADRSAAIEALAAALRERPMPADADDDAPVVPAEVRLAALAELDALGGPTAIERLDELRADPRLAPTASPRPHRPEDPDR